jgi:hypothetical protein
MIRRLGSALLAVSLSAGCGGIEAEPAPGSIESPSIERQQAPLTETDVDVAPECQGLLTFVNTASFATLDVYLPSDVVTHLVNRRAVTPFTSLADVSSVPLVGETRLKQLETGARANAFIGASCVGILDELAVSADDAAAIVALVNSVSSSELHDILPYAWNGAENLLFLRPFTSVQAIANTAGIGIVGFRNIRNAATLSRPLEALMAAVNAARGSGGLSGVSLARHFDWWAEVTTGGYYYGGQECFGLEPNSVPNGAIVRPYLADAAEVRAAVVSAVRAVNWNNQIPSSVVDAGLANLDALTAGRSFKGCYYTYANDPWSENSVAVFIDTVNGFSVMKQSWWSE